MSLFAKKSYVGLDLGHHAIKAVQLERSGSGFKVVRYAVVPTPQDALKDGVVIDPAVMGEAIKEALKEAHITATSALIAAAGGSVFVRPVPFPRMSETALRKSIKYEASRYVPGSVEDSYVEFEILPSGDEARMSVLLVAAPRDIVSSRIRACEEAGLEVEVVDIEMFAMYRSLIESLPVKGQDDEAGPMALVDVGANTTNMSVVDKGVFVMTRSIPQGGRALTDALKNQFKLSEEDAEAGKAQLNVRELLDEDSPRENAPLRVIQTHLDDLVREVRRSLNYFQSQQAEAGETKSVERVLLSGGGANLSGLTEYVSNRLGLPVFSPGVFDNPRIEQGVAPEGPGHDLAVASGLALRAFPNAA
jgi:type IV pilus assembly protein PilM